MASRQRHAANLLSGYIRLGIDVLVKLYVTRILISHLGLGAFGVVTFAMSLGIITNVLTNALSGAAARYVTQGVARGNDQDAASYLTNTLAIITAAGLLLTLLMTTYAILVPKVSADMPLGFLVSMLLSGVMSSLGGVLSCGTFVREKFFLREGAKTAMHLVNGALIIALLLWTSLGVWSVGVAALISSFGEMVIFQWSLRRMLPQIHLRWGLIERVKIREVSGFVGWMLLAYCGQYITRSGTMMIVQANLSKEDLGRFGLAVQVGGFVLQALTFISYMTAPGIYKALALGANGRATSGVQRFLFLSTLMTIAGTVVLIAEGPLLLKLWLGPLAPVEVVPLLAGMVLASGAASFRIPISTFLAGCNRQKGYGIATLVEGVVVVIVSLLLVADGTPRLLALTLFPAGTALVKNLVVLPAMYRSTFQFSPVLAFLRKGLILLGCLFASTVAWMVAERVCPANGILPLGLRLSALLTPFALYAAVRVFGGARVKQSKSLDTAQVLL